MSGILSIVTDKRTTRMRKHTDALNDAGLYSTSVYNIVGKHLPQTEGEPIQIRRAKAIAHLLDNVEINVFPDEPIVGSMMGLWKLKTDLPSYDEQKAIATAAIESYLEQKRIGRLAKKRERELRHKPMEEEVTEGQARWALMSRVHHDASLNYADYQRMLADMEERFSGADIQRYEIGKILEAALRIQYNAEERDLMNKLPWLPSHHLGLDYQTVLNKGFAGINEEIRERCAVAGGDEEKIEFYNAVGITIRAMIDFFKRYAGKLREMAGAGADAGSNASAGDGAGADECSKERRAELALMADILDRMSQAPAQTFREALQTVWLLHVMANIVGGSAMSFSRFDQYMLPFYEHDIKNGVPREDLKELLCCFWIKVNEPKLRTVQSITVGGTRPDGADACTDLTLLCLETARDMKLPYPNIAVRVSRNSPEWLYDAVVDTIKAGCGQPMILNDDVFIPNFKKLGYPDEIANDYFNMGCVELMIQGKQSLWGAGGSVVYTDCLQQTLDAYVRGELKADTFEAFMDYFIGRIRQSIQKCYEGTLVRKKSMDTTYDPFCSILTQDCVARGKDMHHGGSACPPHWSIYAHGLGTLADSLAAIQKFVYEEKKITLDMLIEALDANFEGFEDIHMMLDHGTPAFGNDVDATDNIANRVFYALTKAIFDLNSLGEDKYVATFFSYFSHVLSGEVTKATPNGRLAGQSLSDSMAPTQGKDVNGPTKMLNSILKIDPSYVTGGYALNIKMNPALTKGAQGEKALKSLLKAYLIGMGPQIQVNFIDADALKEAQVQPEKHRNLVVRVGGYCEYFVNLDRTLQNEIIERTEHEAI